MEQGFLFYRVNLMGDALPIDQSVESATPVHPHLTYACLALADTAMMATQIAMDSLIVQVLIKHSLMHFSPLFAIQENESWRKPTHAYSFTD